MPRKKFTAKTPEMPRGSTGGVSMSRSVSGRSSQRAARTDEGARRRGGAAGVDAQASRGARPPCGTRQAAVAVHRTECRPSAEKEMLVNVGLRRSACRHIPSPRAWSHPPRRVCGRHLNLVRIPKRTARIRGSQCRRHVAHGAKRTLPCASLEAHDGSASAGAGG